MILEKVEKYGPIVISILAFYYARKKDKLLYTTKFFPEVRSTGNTKMDIFLKNLGPGMAFEINASAFFFRLYDINIPILKSRRTLIKKVIYTLEYLPAGDGAAFSIDANRFENRRFSSLFKWSLKLKWRGFDNKRHSILYVFDKNKRRFTIANIFKRLYLFGQRYIHSNSNQI